MIIENLSVWYEILSELEDLKDYNEYVVVEEAIELYEEMKR